MIHRTIHGLKGTAKGILLSIRFSAATQSVEVYDFLEITVTTGEPLAQPFLDIRLSGVFGKADEEPRRVDGFCDAQDGTLFRIRFMPTEPGLYQYTVTFHADDATEVTHNGNFTANAANRAGLLRVDNEHPFHFLWEGTGEHFFWNSTTAYHLSGCSKRLITDSIDRLAGLGINRIRVALSSARVPSVAIWYEPTVTPEEEFTFLYGPWLAAAPESVDEPNWDTTRFDISYWRRFESLLSEARRHDIVVAVIFYLDGLRSGAYPFPRDQFGGNADEERYYRYAVARLGAYANVVWDITNEWRLFRNDDWTEAMGGFLSDCDPYGHLTSVHGHGDFPFRTSFWADYALFQSWDEHGGYAFMLRNRREQAATGRPIPQINDEYGYEDHYPGPWGEGRVAPARSADTRRRLAWEMTMAGAYQTTGESATNGLGGWLNGRGDSTMTMLEGYRHLKDFFTAFDWWCLEPSPETADGAMCLAEPDQRYIVYLPTGGSVSIQLGEGEYAAAWYNPRNAVMTALPNVSGRQNWRIPETPDENDWVLHLSRK